MRILVLIAIGLLLYFIIGNYIRRQKLERDKKDEVLAEKMVRCHHCGLHILEQEAVSSQGQFYCSQAHLEAEQNK